jgi:predicted Co/Zn/Cd cation transporter (cation efflux family)
VREGFLGTAAPFYADIVLLLELGMGVSLLVGAILARARKFRAHAWCQSMVVLLNAGVIALAMMPSVHPRVIPGIPLKLGRSFYALATAHAAFGGVVECAAVYILLAAGTTLIPDKFRLVRYKLWMRSVLISWWIVLLLGFATYARWYIPGFFRR